MQRIKNLIICLIIPLLGWAQDIKIQATVSQNTLPADQHFSYTVEVSGNSTGLPSPQLPEFKDFNVLSAPSTSTNMQWINGKMTASNGTTIFLQPRDTGTFTIPAATLLYKGKTYTSNTVTIKVTKTAAKPAAGNKKVQDSEISGQDLYIKTIVSNRRPYLGQQIIVTYKLYFRGEVRRYDFEKRPSYPGFWQEALQLPQRPVIGNEVVNGLNYKTAILHKVALFPTQAGHQQIDALTLGLETVVQNRRSRRSLFDDFFDDPFGRTVRKTIKTKPINVEVRQLPEQGKPATFNGAVGQFDFDVSVDKYTAATNEAISLKLKLRGKGNIKVAGLPTVKIPVDIEQYEPHVSSNISKSGNIISGTKQSDIILIPRIAGQYTIKPVAFSYFDPSNKSYKTIYSKPIHLNIKQGKGTAGVQNAVNQSGLSRQEVALLSSDIRYIKEFTELQKKGYKPWQAPAFWSLILGMLILFTGFIAWDERQARIAGDARLVRKRRAGKLAAKQLARAKKLLKGSDSVEFYKAVSLALQGFVQDKLNLELTEFSAANIRRVLGARGIPEEEIEEYQSVLEETEFQQFAGGSQSTTPQQIFDRARAILTRLEKWI